MVLLRRRRVRASCYFPNLLRLQVMNSFCSSYSAYGRLGFDRRFRLYEISEWGETIRTYKRTEFDEIIDDVVLLGKGAIGA